MTNSLVRFAVVLALGVTTANAQPARFATVLGFSGIEACQLGARVA